MNSPEPDARLRQAFDSLGPVTADLSQCRADQAARLAGVPLAQVEQFALKQGIVPARYRRNLGTFTLEGQGKILGSRVLVAGLGGLGGYVVEQLARAGIGSIVAADPDRFDEQNLNRQLLCTTSDLAVSKVERAVQRVAHVNPATRLLGHAVPWQEMPPSAWEAVAVAFDCLDTAHSRLALEDRCHALGLPLVHGAVGGWCVQVGVSWPGSRLLHRIYKKQFQNFSPVSHGQGIPESPECFEIGSKEPAAGLEATLGTPGFAPGVAASLMVAQGVKLLLGKLAPGGGHLLMGDLLADAWETFALPLPGDSLELADD